MIKNRYIHLRNLATIFIVCNMLYWIFPFPPLFWRVGLVLLSLYAAVSNGNKTLAEKTILVFAGFNLLHFTISFLWQTPSTTQIGNIFCAMLSFSLFAYLGKKGAMTAKYFSVAALCLLAASIFGYYHAQVMAIERLALDSDTDITNNATVYFLFLLPILFFIKKKWLKWLVLVVCLYYLLEGAKRGNILAASIPVVLIVWFELKDSRRSAFKTVAVIIGIVALSIALYQWFTTNDYLMYRLEKTLEGSSSGRDQIYAHAWQTWITSDNIMHYLFGYGFDGILRQPLMNGMYAHNDWLEILVDYGLVGVVLYLSIFISFVKLIRKTKNTQIKMAMLSAVFIWFFKTLYSMGFTEGDMPILMISLGTAVGQSSLQDKIIDSQ